MRFVRPENCCPSPFILCNDHTQDLRVPDLVLLTCCRDTSGVMPVCYICHLAPQVFSDLSIYIYIKNSTSFLFYASIMALKNEI